MNRWIKRAGFIALILAIGFSAFYLGLNEGFGRGYSYQEIHSAPSTAFLKMRTLEKLRNGEIEKAIESIEAELDSEIIVHSMGLGEGPAFPHIIRYSDTSEAANKLFQKVAQYRKIHPSNNEDPNVVKQINETLSRY